MLNQNLKEKRVRYLGWIFSEEKPWELTDRNDFSRIVTSYLNKEIVNSKEFVPTSYLNKEIVNSKEFVPLGTTIANFIGNLKILKILSETSGVANFYIPVK
jgi:hypothetical protein